MNDAYLFNTKHCFCDKSNLVLSILIWSHQTFCRQNMGNKNITKSPAAFLQVIHSPRRSLPNTHFDAKPPLQVSCVSLNNWHPHHISSFVLDQGVKSCKTLCCGVATPSTFSIFVFSFFEKLLKVSKIEFTEGKQLTSCLLTEGIVIIYCALLIFR